MGYENVKLWFAKDENENIITIDEVKDIHNTYDCPICGSSLLPKATESKKVTPHFAHVDVSKCNSESQIHWWFKNSLIEPGDEFKIASDKERLYKCKEILVEHPYPTSFGEYRPDVTVITETGETIYFEMAFSNKKKIEDYLDMWLELKNIVVEVDVKKMLSTDSLPTFKALFYDGKCFNTKKNDIYYETIGRYKEVAIRANPLIIEEVRKLDWLWRDISLYKSGDVKLEDMCELLSSIDRKQMGIVKSILRKQKCNDVYEHYLHILSNNLYNQLNEYLQNNNLHEIYKLNKEEVRKWKKFDTYLIFFEYQRKSPGWDCYDFGIDVLVDSYEEVLKELIFKTKRLFGETYEYGMREYASKNKRLMEAIECLEGVYQSYFPNFQLYLHNDNTLSINFYNSFEKNFKLQDNIILSDSHEFIFSTVQQCIHTVAKDMRYPVDFNKIEIISKRIENCLDNYHLYDTFQNKRRKHFTISVYSTFNYYSFQHNLLEFYLGLDGDSLTRSGYYYYLRERNLYRTKRLNYSGKLSQQDLLIELKSYDDLFPIFENEFIDMLIKESSAIKCKVCKDSCMLNRGEAKSFYRKKYFLPKICSNCRKNRKKNKGVTE
ncbi:MAG: hypothetical protein ACI35O_14445 [Bacillaceae bacterium]